MRGAQKAMAAQKSLEAETRDEGCEFQVSQTVLAPELRRIYQGARPLSIPAFASSSGPIRIGAPALDW